MGVGVMRKSLRALVVDDDAVNVAILLSEVRLAFEVDGRAADKELAVGDGYMRVSARRPGWDWSEALMHPRATVSSWPASRRRRADDLLAFVRAHREVHPRAVDAHFAHGSVTNWMHSI